jgi:hypothetical protein
VIRLEQETIINFNEDEQRAIVYTYNKPLRTKLNKLCKEYPDDFAVKRKDTTGSTTYEIPKQYISIRGPRKLTEKQKEEMRGRGKALHKFKE